MFIPELSIADRFSPEEQGRIRKALGFAAEAHKTQLRKGGAPYITHPAAVAGLLMHEFNADADTVLAGLLHDTVEDTDVTLEDVEREFGPQVRFLVDGATDHGEGDGNPQVRDKLERAKHSKEKALRYAAQDERVLLVKIADRWDNLKTVHVHTPRGQIGYSTSSKEFHIKEARRLGFARQAEAMDALCDATIAKWAAYGGMP
jgi:GTP pyrophosphokinase